MNWPFTWRRALCLCIFLLCGCGAEQEPRPALQPAQGKLLINGEPAPGAMLVLSPADGKTLNARGSRPRANVGEDGTFQVTTYQSGDGAPAGEYLVGILWFDNPDSSHPWDQLGNKYANPETTGIRISIQEGENQLEPIAIDNARLVKRPVRPRNSQDFDQVD